MAASTGPASPISAVLVPSVKNNGGEAPIAILRVQIISFDVFALDSISVVITFGSQRVTSLVRRRAPIDESIFDLPVFSSMVETRGALLELVVYPRSPLSKGAQMAHSVGGDTSRHSAFVGEFGLVLPQWFQRDGNEPIYAFDDVRNYAHEFHLARSQSSATVSTVLTKVGLVSLDSSLQDLWVVYEEILSKSQRATNKLLSLPPVQAVGAFRPGTDPYSPTSSAQADATAQTSEDFEIDWDSTPVDFHCMSERSIMGVVLLQIQGAHGLPEVGPSIPRGSGMDPYIIIKYNDELYRTKVIRQSLDPLFKDRFVLLVHRPIRRPDANTTAQIPESPAVTLSVSNWAKPLGHQHIGDAVLDLQLLIEAAPRPDPETGFYSMRALQSHTFSEMDLNVDPKQGGRWNHHPCPSIRIRAKYESSGATRQRCWVSKLGGFGGGLVSCFQLLGTLEAIGLPTLPEHIDMFFKKRGRNPERDWLSVTEAIISLEEYCQAPQVKAGGAPTDPGKPKTDNANASSTAGSPVDVLAPTYALRIEPGDGMGGIAGVIKDGPWEGSRNNTRDIGRAREVPRPLPVSPPHRSQHPSPEHVTPSASGFHAPPRVLPPIPKPVFFPALPGSSIGSTANSADERSPSGEPSDPLTPARALDPHNSDLLSVTRSPARLESSDSSDFEDDSSDTVEDPEDVESCIPLSPHLPQLLNIGQRPVYSLQGSEAAEAGSKLHSYLKCCSTDPLEYSPALRLLQDLCTRSGELPACFRLENVTFNRGELVGKGGEASVYAGQLNNQKVVVREIVMTRDFWRSPEGKKVGQTFFEKGKAAFRRKDYPQTVVELTRFMAMSPVEEDAVEASLYLGTSLMETKKHEDAIPYLQRFIAGDKRAKAREYAMFMLVQAFDVTGQRDKGSEVAREAVTTYPAGEFANAFKARLTVKAAPAAPAAPATKAPAANPPTR